MYSIDATRAILHGHTHALGQILCPETLKKKFEPLSCLPAHYTQCKRQLTQTDIGPLWCLCHFKGTSCALPVKSRLKRDIKPAFRVIWHFKRTLCRFLVTWLLQ